VKRRTFIAGLGSAVACPFVARAQQAERVRRIGVLLSGDENGPVRKTWLHSRKRLRAWFGPMAATCGWTFGGWAVTSTGYERSPRSWSACNPTSSCQRR
jgi:hypothetical protein